MERILDSQLEEIKKRILIMGGYVEMTLTEVIAALVGKDKVKFKSVHNVEKKINEDHKKIDNECMAFLAKQGPVAKDLRMVLAVIKINTDLERMGDQLVNISYSCTDYLDRKPLGTVKDIIQMSDIVRTMVRQSLDSFVQGDALSAKMVLEMDDAVDKYKNQIFHDLVSHIKAEPSDADAALDLILIARNFERLGDHATNIAENAIFVTTGQDIRHGGVNV